MRKFRRKNIVKKNRRKKKSKKMKPTQTLPTFNVIFCKKGGFGEMTYASFQFIFLFFQTS